MTGSATGTKRLPLRSPHSEPRGHSRPGEALLPGDTHALASIAQALRGQSRRLGDSSEVHPHFWKEREELCQVPTRLTVGQIGTVIHTRPLTKHPRGVPTPDQSGVGRRQPIPRPLG